MREVYSLSRNRVKVVGPLTGEQEAALQPIDKLMLSKKRIKSKTISPCCYLYVGFGWMKWITGWGEV